MTTAYLGLGSNVGEREVFIQAAVDKLALAGLEIRRLSPFYETEPQGFAGQRWFLNAVVEVATEVKPSELLARIQDIEIQLGRRRNRKDGPRTIDIDILLYGGLVSDEAELTIPHPRYTIRRFVLAPLADLVPELRDPTTGRTVRDMLAELTGQAIRRV